MLCSLGADHIVPGWFVLDRHIQVRPGTVRPNEVRLLDETTAEQFYRVVDAFSTTVHSHTLVPIP